MENSCIYNDAQSHYIVPIETIDKNKTIKEVGVRCAICGWQEGHDETR